MGSEPRLTVLHVVPSYYPAAVYGGPIFSIHYACQALARQGVDVRVSTTNANGDGKLPVDRHAPVTLEPNYQVRYYDDTIIGRFSWGLTLNLWRHVRTADVVHLQDVYSILAVETLLLAKLIRRPVLISPRGSFSPWGMKAKRPLLKRGWNSLLIAPLARDRRRVAWHATAESERDEILAAFPKAKVHVVPNGIDCAVFDAEPPLPRAEYLARFFPRCRVAPEEARILVGMGRLHPKKSFDIAITAFAAVAEQHPGAVLLIAGGDDGERARLERLIAEFGFGNRVALVGELPGADKIAFLKGADLFLFPSHSENFGMVCLEALAAGLPVVASRNTPWSEVEAAGSGLWVENSPEAFAAAIAALLSRDLASMRPKARAHAARYDLSSVASAFRNIYQELLETRKQPVK